MPNLSEHRLWKRTLGLSILTLFLFHSCSVVKRLKPNEHLVTQNKIIVDGGVNKASRVNNLVIQQPNSGIGTFFGVPIKLHIYNLARPNIDSIIRVNILEDSSKVARKVNWLSRKQLDKELETRKGFNAWLKRTGEAPVIYSEEKTEATAELLRKFYFSRGWFNADVTYSVEKDSQQRAQVTYKVQRNEPYIIDSIHPKISSPAIVNLYKDLKKDSYLKVGEPYNEDNFSLERERINTYLRNTGFYHFGKEYITFEADTILGQHKMRADVIISDRVIRGADSTVTKAFKPHTIREVNIFTDFNYSNRLKTVSDSVKFNGVTLYSKEELKYKPKALTDAVFMNAGETYSDLARIRTSRYLNNLQMFRYPNINFVEHPEDSSLTANIILQPKEKYSLNFDVDVSQSNIQTVGFSFGTGLKIRNLFKGAEILDITGFTSIGASKDRSNVDDPFFDINELGVNLRLTIPRIFSPFNTDKIIPKYMSPSTMISLSSSSQTNIGLDKQTLSSFLSYNWEPTTELAHTLRIFDILYVRNLNTDNYFGVYSTSYELLNSIAQSINYIDPEADLTIPDQAETFIDDVLSNNTSLNPQDPDYIAVNNIEERKERLTENNLILSSSFDWRKNTRTSIFDNDFSIFKWRVEVAGNLLSTISRLAGVTPNSNDNYEMFGVVFSQYFKTELDYVKYFDLGNKNVFAFRSYAGIALPYGNSNNIPFVESFFGGGPNDNRAWTPYRLGPGSTQSTDEFNEANFKIHLSAEQRFNLFGNLDSALFVDIGNIWNVLDNVEDDAATFSGIESLRDIAVGSGFGLRYDFNFFVMRFDVGFKTYNPAYDLNNRWFRDYNFSRAVYNIGINYPF